MNIIANMSLWSNNTSDGSYFRYGSLICGIAIVPVAILGICGNCIAANVFRRQRHGTGSKYSPSPPQEQSRSSINILLIGLTITDTLLLLFATPLCSTIAFYNFRPENSQHLLTGIAYMTLITYPLSMIAQCVSVWTMVLISVERYLAISHPLIARAHIGAGKIKKAFLVVVIAAILYNICRFGEYQVNESGDGIDPLLRDNDIYIDVYMNWSYFTLVFALPFLVLLVANAMITRTIAKARRKRSLIVQLSREKRREQTTALMMGAVVLAYMACNTLALLLNGWEAVGATATGWSVDTAQFSFLCDLNNLLIEAHSSLTFLVYFRFSGHFRGYLYKQCRYLCRIRREARKRASGWGERLKGSKSRLNTLLLGCGLQATHIAYGTTQVRTTYTRVQDSRLLRVVQSANARRASYVTDGSFESRNDPFDSYEETTSTDCRESKTENTQIIDLCEL